MTFFYVGLALIIVGTGLLKPNISVMVAELYPEGAITIYSFSIKKSIQNC